MEFSSRVSPDRISSPTTNNAAVLVTNRRPSAAAALAATQGPLSARRSAMDAVAAATASGPRSTSDAMDSVVDSAYDVREDSRGTPGTLSLGSAVLEAVATPSLFFLEEVRPARSRLSSVKSHAGAKEPEGRRSAGLGAVSACFPREV
eukprot:scaffold4937_cov30-Tisochrysis_lutea.AAC.5